jgi:hypothetical protein
MFDAYLPLHILFVLMSAFVFYCVSRNHSKFKFDLNSDWFCLKKILKKRKGFSISLAALGRNLASP